MTSQCDNSGKKCQELQVSPSDATATSENNVINVILQLILVAMPVQRVMKTYAVDANQIITQMKIRPNAKHALITAQHVITQQNAQHVRLALKLQAIYVKNLKLLQMNVIPRNLVKNHSFANQNLLVMSVASATTPARNVEARRNAQNVKLTMR
uniref:Uncharacterized protein n=1 Tax=Spironucleus salmonicida TaxID=348837 RepID=V6LCZ2_9EUKA|eukprot:EST42355.1 Hypothetical protein SS50377_18083 [Spironucleus salmonicida]